MSDNIVTMPGVNLDYPKTKQNEAVVELLRSLLERAEAGRITAMVVGFVDEDGDDAPLIGHASRSHAKNAANLLLALEIAKREHIDELYGVTGSMSH